MNKMIPFKVGYYCNGKRYQRRVMCNKMQPNDVQAVMDKLFHDKFNEEITIHSIHFYSVKPQRSRFTNGPKQTKF